VCGHIAGNVVFADPADRRFQHGLPVPFARDVFFGKAIGRTAAL